MSELIKVIEGEIIKRNYSFEDLKKDNPQVSFPRDYLTRSANELSEYGIFLVREEPKPKFQLLHSQTKNPLELVNEEWVQSFSNVPLSFDVSQTFCLEIVKGKRREAIFSGISFNGNMFSSDADSQNAITIAAMQAASDATFSADWKLSGGGFVTLNATELSGLFVSLNNKIQAAFTEEKQRIDAINNCTTFEELIGLSFISQASEE